MEEGKDSEKLIGKLIKKRKAENEAFMKMLNAMENKATIMDKPFKKRKPKAS
jgi:hypothetical protein